MASGGGGCHDASGGGRSWSTPSIATITTVAAMTPPVTNAQATARVITTRDEIPTAPPPLVPRALPVPIVALVSEIPGMATTRRMFPVAARDRCSVGAVRVRCGLLTRPIFVAKPILCTCQCRCLF